MPYKDPEKQREHRRRYYQANRWRWDAQQQRRNAKRAEARGQRSCKHCGGDIPSSKNILSVYCSTRCSHLRYFHEKGAARRKSHGPRLDGWRNYWGPELAPLAQAVYMLKKEAKNRVAFQDSNQRR